MGLIERLQEKAPKRNLVFTAIEELNHPDQIRQFYQEYIFWLWDNTKDKSIKQNPEQVANSNIGYILGYYDKEITERWMRVLPKVSHPVFGREILFGNGKEVSEYAIVFKSDNKQMAQAVIDNLREGLLYHKDKERTEDPLVEKLKSAFSERGFTIVDDFFPRFDMVVEEDKNSNSKYMAAKLHVEDRGSRNLGSNQIYALLCGYVQGMKSRIAKRLGAEPEIFIERIYKTQPVSKE